MAKIKLTKTAIVLGVIGLLIVGGFIGRTFFSRSDECAPYLMDINEREVDRDSAFVSAIVRDSQRDNIDSNLCWIEQIRFKEIASVPDYIISYDCFVPIKK